MARPPVALPPNDDSLLICCWNCGASERLVAERGSAKARLRHRAGVVEMAEADVPCWAPGDSDRGQCPFEVR